MKPEEIFGLIVRVAGLWLLIWGGWNLLAALKYGIFAVIGVENLNLGRIFNFAGTGIPTVLLGLSLLFGADWLVAETYRKTRQE